jgi:adenine-specific DNA-methyltransferase
MPIKYIPYLPDTIEGQAILNNFVRTRRALKYRGNDDEVKEKIIRGMPYYELEKRESIGNNSNNMLIRGECVSACAYMKVNGIKVDLVYIDPPFASGADYAKKVYIRKNPKVAQAIKKAEEKMEYDELKSFEEKMYGDIWNKESYLNWMYENLMAIKSVMNPTAFIYAHIGVHIGHYFKVLLDEVFGENNFRNEIVVKRIKKNVRERELVKTLNAATDSVFFYTVNEESLILPPQREDKRPERWHGFDAAGFRNGMDYDLFGFKPAPSRHWHWKEQKAKDAIKNYKVWEKKYSQNEKLTEYWSRTDYKLKFLRPNPNTGKPEYFIPESDTSLCDSLWEDIPTYSFVRDYATEKSFDLLERIIKTYPEKKIIVADFFGGSGITAEVANSLGHNFIHVDIGVNSIQTTRDHLISAKAEFDILEIKDGVNLFRNPVQTMDKLKTMILGLKNEDKLDKFWEGSIQDSKLGTIPVYLPNLLDHTTKVLDKYLMNRVLNEAIPALPDGVKKVVVYYIDIDDEKEIKEFIKEQTTTDIEIELRDLKQILVDVVSDDVVEYKIKEVNGVYEIEIKKFISDRLRKKIDEHNQRGLLQPLTKTENDNGEDQNDDADKEEEKIDGKKKKKISPIEISKDGLELIELISFDCKNQDGIWHSDKEIKVDKHGYIIEDGKETKAFWDAKIFCNVKPLRMKVRNIAGDEIIISKIGELKLSHKKEVIVKKRMLKKKTTKEKKKKIVTKQKPMNKAIKTKKRIKKKVQRK